MLQKRHSIEVTNSTIAFFSPSLKQPMGAEVGKLIFSVGYVTGELILGGSDKKWIRWKTSAHPPITLTRL